MPHLMPGPDLISRLFVGDQVDIQLWRSRPNGRRIKAVLPGDQSLNRCSRIPLRKAAYYVYAGFADWDGDGIRFNVYTKDPRFRLWVRQVVLEREGFRCYWCQEVLQPNECTLDHLIPRSLDGPRIPQNLVCACRDCNLKRDNRCHPVIMPAPAWQPDVLKALN